MRIPFFDMAEDDCYVTALGNKLSPEESEIFHCSSGKLRGSEIGLFTNRDEESLSSVFESLEQKKAIVYHMF